jgi:hypothetical protein
MIYLKQNFAYALAETRQPLEPTTKTRQIQYKPGKYAYQCDRCDQWIRLNAKDVQAAATGIQSHQESQKCQEIAACLLASRSFDPAVQDPSPTTCPGVPLLWPDVNFFNSYPWHLHDKTSSYQLPWTLSKYNDVEESFLVRSRKCKGAALSNASPCPACISVQQDILLKFTSMHSQTSRHSNYIYRSRQQLLELVKRQQVQIETKSLNLLNLQKTLKTTPSNLEDYQRLHELLGEASIPRLPEIVAVARRRKESVCKLTERIEAAIKGSYHARRNYTQREYDLALLALRMGGFRLLFALCQEFGLPSLRTLMRSHIQIVVEASYAEPDSDTIIQNLVNVLVRPYANRPSPRVGCHIALDETAIKPTAAYVPAKRLISGICPCSGGLEVTDLEVYNEEDVISLSTKIFPEEGHDAECHFASQATVVAASFLGKSDYRDLPFVIAGGCGTKDGSAFCRLLHQIIDTWERSGAQSRFGWFWSVATDGDSSRRRGGFDVLLKDKLDQSNELGKLICPLHGMNLMVGPHNITLDFDWKHIIKRTSVNKPLN